MADQKPEAKDAAEQLAGLRYLQQLYANQYNAVTQLINDNLQAIAEINGAQKSLENSGVISGKKSLISAGAEVYFDATVSKVDNVVVGIGGGYLAEKPVDDAKQYLNRKAERQTALINKLSKDRKDLENAMLEVAQKIEALTR
ncbi:MAG: prefoldin subunit alpha [Candidatus Micrarchaeota archaeon]|nr:prefoldin subunit alpha [Candidatus Micrarchaeota archaeon]